MAGRDVAIAAERFCFGGTGVIRRKEGDRHTTAHGIYPNCCCMIALVKILHTEVVLVCETPTNGLGGAAVGQQSEGPAFLWEWSDKCTQIIDEVDSICVVSAHDDENLNGAT